MQLAKLIELEVKGRQAQGRAREGISPPSTTHEAAADHDCDQRERGE